ncbi:hypothetical protein G6F31_021766 [Rhizopus arrhizus]|nr:hypothetical protein G6F31_021766 [Rhizopus arrhizus]
MAQDLDLGRGQQRMRVRRLKGADLAFHHRQEGIPAVQHAADHVRQESHAPLLGQVAIGARAERGILGFVKVSS